MSALGFCRSLQLLLTYLMPDHSDVVFCLLENNNEFFSTSLKLELATCHSPPVLEHQVGSTVSNGQGFLTGEANNTAVQLQRPEDLCSASYRRHIIIPIWSPQSSKLLNKILDYSVDEVTLDAHDFHQHTGFHPAPINGQMYLIVGPTNTTGPTLHASNSTFACFEVYKIVHKVIIRRLMLNHIEASDVKKLSLIRRRQDFKQDVITCTVEVEKYGELAGTKVHDVNGVLAFIQTEAGIPLAYLYFASLFNFRQHIIIGGYFGFQNETMEGADTLQQLQSGQSKIYLMTHTMIPQRARYLSYLVSSFRQGSIKALFRQPKFSEARNVFFIPFKFHVWLAIIGALASVVLVVVITRWCIGPWISVSDSAFVGNSGIWIIGALVQQAWDSVPTSPTLRIVAFVGFVTTSLLYNCYAAKILAVFSDSAPAISSTNGLFGSNFLFIGDIGNAFAPQKQVYEKRYRKRINNEKNTTKVSQKVWSGKYAYIGFLHVEHLQLPQTTDTEFCEQIYVMDMDTVSVKNAMMVAKNSSLRSFFNYGLIKLIESGFLQRYNKQLAQGKCDKSEAKVLIEALNIEDLYFAFLVLCGGMIVGTLSLGCEKFNVARKVLKRIIPAIS